MTRLEYAGRQLAVQRRILRDSSTAMAPKSAANGMTVHVGRCTTADGVSAAPLLLTSFMA